MFGYLKRRRRQRLRSLPFPEEWLEILKQNVPFYARLQDNDQRVLHGLVRIFLAEKSFEGCGGLVLTDEIRVTIAAHACRLVLRRPDELFRRLISVLVYPSAYLVKSVEPIGGGAVLEGEQIRLGEAWREGVVVIAWDEVKAASRAGAGRNLVLHEFAHVLDMDDGAADGTPVLDERARYASWARTMEEEHERLRRHGELGLRTVLDEYGAESPAEFFAVATEAFFEKPATLRARHPELYEELSAYYRQDPAAPGRSAHETADQGPAIGGTA